MSLELLNLWRQLPRPRGLLKESLLFIILGLLLQCQFSVLEVAESGRMIFFFL